MPHKTLINGTNYGISGGKTYVGGTNYAVKSGKTEISSSFYNINFGPTVGGLPVGNRVYMNVNNVRTDFLIVHQGLPSSDYDSSCNGTWLLMKDVYERKVWDSSNNDYANSDIHSYLNGTFLNLFDNSIKQIKLPYWMGVGNSGSYQTGSSGLSTKIFLLSGYEVGLTKSDASFLQSIGAKLSYFENGTSESANNKRIANENGSATWWWLRSPFYWDAISVGGVRNDGVGFGPRLGCQDSICVRPALVLSSTTKIDENFNIIR